MLKLKNIHLRHAVNNSLADKRDTGIFKQNWFNAKRSDAATEIKNGFEIFKLDETTIATEVNIDENWKNSLLYMIYVNITIGDITIDFLPSTFKELLINLLLYKKLFVGGENKDNEKIEREFVQLMLHQHRVKEYRSKAQIQKDVLSFKKVHLDSRQAPGRRLARVTQEQPAQVGSNRRESLNESKAQLMEELKRRQEKQADLDKKKLQKTLDDLQGYFSKFVLSLKMNIRTLALKINNNENEEVMIVKYGNEEIVFDIDLVFKERTHIKVLGLELESRHGFNVFMKLANNMIADLSKIKAILDN